MKSIKAAKLRTLLQKKLNCFFRTKYLKRLPVSTIDYYTFLLNIKSGDLVHDCDGFNHVVVEVGFVDWWEHGITGNLILSLICRVGDGNRFTCGCLYSPDFPQTRKNIEKYFKNILCNEGSTAPLKSQGWWDDLSDLRRQVFLNGRHICDENGIAYSKSELEGFLKEQETE